MARKRGKMSDEQKALKAARSRATRLSKVPLDEIEPGVLCETAHRAIEHSAVLAEYVSTLVGISEDIGGEDAERVVKLGTATREALARTVYFLVSGKDGPLADLVGKALAATSALADLVERQLSERDRDAEADRIVEAVMGDEPFTSSSETEVPEEEAQPEA